MASDTKNDGADRGDDEEPEVITSPQGPSPALKQLGKMGEATLRQAQQLLLEVQKKSERPPSLKE